MTGLTFSEYPILFKLNHGATKILPAHVMDVAEALNVMLTAPIASVGQTFSLPGPGLHTYSSLEQLVSALTLKPVSSAPVLPKPVAMLLATIFNRAMWWPTISPDEVERKYIDDLGVDAFDSAQTAQRPAGWGAAALSNAGKTGVDGEPVRGWADLGIEPETIEEHAIKYLRRYRSA
jgi:NADH dehydrogenase (ubiquinone) 1 alpha subcomplex subunit 9